MAYRFKETDYEDKDEMLDALVYDFMTAGGSNPVGFISEQIESGITARQFASEAVSHLQLHPHMKTYSYSMDELVEAMAWFIRERPDVKNGFRY